MIEDLVITRTDKKVSGIYPNGIDKPTVIASSVRRTLEVYNLYVLEKSEWDKLISWYHSHRKSTNKTITFIRQNTLNLSFAPETLRIFKLLKEEVKEFNIRSQTNVYYPIFRGDFDNNYIQLSGESYGSFITVAYQDFYDWIDLFLSKKPTQLRMEFFLTYVNTSSSRQILIMMSLFKEYKLASGATISMIWYVEENDIDSEEMGLLYQKEIPFLEVRLLDDSQWEKMIK